MSLFEKQQVFSHAVGMLLCYAHQEGYGLTLGDSYRDPRVFGKLGVREGYGSANSNHKLRLAIDVNLFINGEYIKDSDHQVWIELHDFFEALGGAPIIIGDANHFSFMHYGAR